MAALFPRFLRKERMRHFIAVDLGSDSAVRSLLFDQSGRDSAALEKQVFKLPRREPETAVIAPVIEHLRRTISSYVRRAGRRPDEVLFGLGGQFVASSVTKEEKLRKDPRQAVRPEELGDLLTDHFGKNRNKAMGRGFYTLAALQPLGVTVDGYDVALLRKDTRGKTLAMSLLATYVISPYWESLRELESMWGGVKIRFIDNHLAIAGSVASGLNLRDALVVKVGAKTTEVSVIESGRIIFAGKTALGGESFSLALARTINSGFAEAEEIKRLRGVIALPSRTNGAFDQAMLSTTELWLARLVELLKGGKNLLLPQVVLLTGGGSNLGAIRDALAAKPWHRELTFFDNVAARKLSAEDLALKIFRNSSPRLAGPEETALAALAFTLQNELL